MKTCEFGFGALGYIRKYKKVREDSYKILLIGTHGQNNIGDELLLETFLFQLRRFVNKQVLDFFVNSYQPEVTEAVFNVKSFHTLKEKYKLLFYILRCDCIFFAGGSIVKELYSAYGRNKYSVLNILVFLVGFSKIIMRKKIILSNIGIGPLETKKGLRKAKFVLSHSDFVSVRDLESIKYGRMVGIDKLILVPDAVLSLDKNYFKLVDINDRKINSLMDVHKIGFNLCRNISKPAVWNNFIIEMMNFFEILFNYNPDIEIIGLPMQQNYSCDDYKTLNEFQIQLKKRLPRIKIKILRPKEAKEVAKIINDCDLMIVERLHGAVLSTIIHVPFISLEYDVKVKSYLAEIDFKDNGVDISESFDAREVFGKVKTVAENYSKQVCKLKSVSSEKKFLADKYFIQLREDLYS
ncbi:MAG: polysaccharide pyruvyl transferase family protein [Candidatus Moranbacteria bacterium]|nr:polysaccharide pyruvyl transferase family protein [Candidatus Moranbacteria bacterium]